MEKPEVQQDMRVQVSGWGKGTVVDLMPESKFYVKVKYDLDASPKCRGQEVNAEVAKMKPLAPPKPTAEEKYQATFEKIKHTPESYYLAGLIAVGPVNFHFSTPPDQLASTEELLAQHGIDWDSRTLTVSSDRTQGRSFSVRMQGHGLEKYQELTGVKSTPYFDTGIVSLQARQFVIDFLCDFLKFDPRKRSQDVAAIRSRVPKEFQAEFQKGVDAGLGESLMEPID